MPRIKESSMFKKYNSIENSYRTEFLDRILGHNFWNLSYAIQEKVHGSNLSFYSVDGQNFNAAKRTEGLKDDERFYNHQSILEKHIDKFRAIYESICQEVEHVEQVSIYGEVIGGSYPHKEVKRNHEALKVQKGIFYSPNNEFYAFDIQINRELYLDVEYINGLFEKYELLYARTLFRGSLNECLKYPNMFGTTIPQLLGLPEIEPNYCEGVIIKPLKTCYFNNGTRVILKNKNEKWTENSKHIKTIKKEAPLSEKVTEFQAIIGTYATENRLNNVLSKMSEVTIKDFGKIIGSFNRDIIEDFAKDYNAQFMLLEKKEQKLVTKSIGYISSSMIKNYFKQ